MGVYCGGSQDSRPPRVSSTHNLLQSWPGHEAEACSLSEASCEPLFGRLSLAEESAFDPFWQQQQQQPLNFGACFCLLLCWPAFRGRICRNKEVNTRQPPSLFAVLPPAPRQLEFVELQMQKQYSAGTPKSVSSVIEAQNSTNPAPSPPPLHPATSIVHVMGILF